MLSCEDSTAMGDSSTSSKTKSVDNNSDSGSSGTSSSSSSTSTSDSSTVKMSAAEQAEFFKTYVALGDSLSQGCQSLNVEQGRQYYSWPAQLARAIGTEFNQPLIEFPGVGMPNIEDAFKNGWFDTWAKTAAKLLKTMLYWHRVDRYADQAKLNNFAISGATVDDILAYDGKKITRISDSLIMTMVGIFNPWVSSVVGLNPMTAKSAIDQALDRDPTFITILLGNNDIIFATIMGDDSSALMTDVDKWKANWDALVAKIKAKSTVKGVLLVTLPDNTDIPFLQPAANKYCTISEGADIPEGSKVPFFSTRVSKPADVITPAQIEVVHNRVVAVNEIIKQTAETENWALCDVYTYVKNNMNSMKLRYANGTASNIEINYDYATGGFFSLDGIHPSSTGYAHLTNEAIKATNSHYGTSIPMLDEVAVWEKDTLQQDPIDPREYPDQMGNMTYLFNTFVRIMAQII